MPNDNPQTTTAQKRILEKLKDGAWHTEDELKTTFSFLQNMCFAKLIDGAGRRDDRGTGNYKTTRLWKIADAGKGVL